MALLTTDLNMHAGERIARLGMVKLAHAFPVGGVVAPLAICSEASIVLVLMTGNAIGGETQESSIQVALLDQWPEGGGNMASIVTTIAADASVFSVKSISS